MKFNYKNSNVNYEYYDNNSKISLVFLHGWGQNIQMMIPLAKPFIKKYNCMIIDLPGFGDSEEPQEVYTIYDYAEMVNKLLTSKKIKNPIIIGHSFGGKIALVYATKYKTNKIVLLASPYKKKIEKDNFKLKILRFCKKVPLLNRLEGIAKKYIGSTDYKNASDAAVSLEDGKQLEKLIPNAGLVIYDGCTHYAYLERLNQTINVLRSFIESEE